MENFPGYGPDYSSLAETPKSPEKKRDDDDDKEGDKKDKKLSVFERDKSPEKLKEEKAEKKNKPEPPLEKLAEDEKQMVAAEVVSSRREALKDELKASPDESSVEQEALAGAAFIEALSEEIGSGTSVDEAIDNAEEKTLEITGIEKPSEADPMETTSPENIDDEDSALPTPSPVASPMPPAGGGGLPPRGGGPILPLGGGMAPQGPVGPSSVGGNVLPVVPLNNPNQLSDAAIERHGVRRGLLVGGIVGYLIGRRRGRIKTEKKLLPIQQKLEKEVTNLQQKILLREEKIRQATREYVALRPEAGVKMVERMQQLHELKHGQETIVDATINDPSEAMPIPRKQPERIGKFAMLAERPATLEKPQSVESMTVPELLIIAERIKIEQSSVKRLYESHRLDDQGLRRIIRAYLRGEHYDRVLRENLVSPEALATQEAYETQPANSLYHSQNAYPTTVPTLPNTQTEPSQLPASHKYANMHNQTQKRDTLRVIITVAVICAVAFVVIIAIR